MTNYERPRRDHRDWEPDPRTAASLALAEAHQDTGCTKCLLGDLTNETTCMWGTGPVPCDFMIIGDAPDIMGSDLRWGQPMTDDVSRIYFAEQLEDLGLDLYTDVYRTHAVKCYVPGQRDLPGKRDKVMVDAVKECGPTYLDAEIDAVKPRAILALGARAYWHFAHKAGVTKNRGQAFEWTTPSGEHTCWVVPALNPYAITQNPSMHPAFRSDVQKFVRLGRGESQSSLVEIIDVRSPEGLMAMAMELSEDDGILTFDLETRGFKDTRAAYSKVWNAALTRGKLGPNGIRVWNVPLEHPQSPYYTSPDHTRLAVNLVIGLIFEAERVNGHNVKFDVRHLTRLAERYGIEVPFAAHTP